MKKYQTAPCLEKYCKNVLTGSGTVTKQEYDKMYKNQQEAIQEMLASDDPDLRQLGVMLKMKKSASPKYVLEEWNRRLAS